MRNRAIKQIFRAMPAADGAGVKLLRSIGARPGPRLDPFLLLDEFSSDNPDDYIAGFPSHPHRGFQTVTYMLEGRMRHEDHLGNRGDLGPGDVQWMRAGRGIIHSEMPQQTAGKMRGFQLWINLPAAQKMLPPDYQDVGTEDIPLVELAGQVQLKLIAGRLLLSGVEHAGPIQDETTDAIFADIRLPAAADLNLPIPSAMQSFIYVYQGRVTVEGRTLESQQVGVLGTGDTLQLSTDGKEVGLLLLAGRPIGEPVVQYGPFVMNTRAEIEQALRDHAGGTLTK